MRQTLQPGFLSGRTPKLRFLVAFCGILCAASCAAYASPVVAAKGVQPVCTVLFNTDKVYPARVPDAAAPCLAKAAQALTAAPGSILVLIGTAERDKDWSPNGNMRETEDTTGKDLRFWDIAAYRSVDTKDYLVRWNKVPASRIAARTAYSASQKVAIYLVPATADLVRSFPRTVPIFEDPCTIKPCPKPDEEDLHPIHRDRIPGS